MVINKNIKLDITNLVLQETRIIDRRDIIHAVECINDNEEEQEIYCPITVLPNHRNVVSVYNANFSYYNLGLAGLSTEISLSVRQNYNISSNVFGLNLNQNQLQSLNVTANWKLNENIESSFNITSAKLPNVNGFSTTLSSYACLRLEFLDRVYKLYQRYSVRTVLRTDNPSDDLVQIARNITNNGNIYNDNNVISFDSSLELLSNYIVQNVTMVTPIDCPSGSTATTIAPTTTPTPTQGNIAIRRFGIVTDSITFRNSIEPIYGFDSNQADIAFYTPYNGINKFDTLVVGSQCFKIRIWIVIPAFFIIIIFPLWVDVDIITAVLGGLATALDAALKVVKDIKSKVDEIENQINVKNAVALAARGAAIGKLVVTGKANQELLNAAKNYATAQLKNVEAATNLIASSEELAKIREIVEKLEAIITSITRMQNIVQNQGNSPLSFQVLYEILKDDIVIVMDASKALVEFIKDVPKNKITDLVKLIIKDIEDIYELTKELIISISIKKDIISVIQTRDAELPKISYKILSKVLSIFKRFNIIKLDFASLVELVKSHEAIKLLTELDESAANQTKTELEQFAEETATELATAVDDLAEKFGGINPLLLQYSVAEKQLQLGIMAAEFASSALNSAVDGIGQKKKDMINGMISAYLRNNLDIYKVSRLGKFDANNPLERQIVVNDIAGTRIYSKDGRELYNRKDFCNLPLARVEGEINSGGCSSGTDACGLGTWSCGELNYWYSAFQYRVSFDFYNNHDLSKGGIIVGDFDGDGIDDLWCHYPSSTRGYNPDNANQIIYSPLRAKESDNRVSYELTLNIDGWCGDGVVKIGDFNSDKKDDVLCIANSGFCLLYSNGGSFYPASSRTDGLISIVNVVTSSAGSSSQQISTWQKTDNILVGDFDGDGYADLVKVTASSLDILYGHRENIFVQRPDVTSAWSASHQSQLIACSLAGINKIIIGDVNNDGKDDISCVTGTTSSASTVMIDSTIPTYTNNQPSGGIVRLSVVDVNLHPINKDFDIQRNVRINDHTTNNKISNAEKILISIDEMLPTHKTVSNAYLSLECLRLYGYKVETYFTLSTSYSIDENVVWASASSNSKRSIDIEMTAKFDKDDLKELLSNTIQSFEYKLESFYGGCYQSEAVTNLVSVTVHFNATIRMTIEREDQLLFGRVLEEEVVNILPSFDGNGDFVSFPVQGYITLNLLGHGYDTINNCD